MREHAQQAWPIAFTAIHNATSTDGTQFIPLQRARCQGLGQLLGGGGDFLLRGARGDGDALQAADQRCDLIGSGTNFPRRDGKPREGINAFTHRDITRQAQVLRREGARWVAHHSHCATLA
jgi:hypothetical protein